MAADDTRLHPDPPRSSATSALTDEEQMLLLLRDELYEGSWDDFVEDLEARLNNRPHVFEVQPPSPRLQETIRHHLALINNLRQRKR